MNDMVRDVIDQAAVHAVPAIAPALLAEVACCQNVPEVRGNIEPSVEPQLALNEVLDGRFLVREIVGRSGMASQALPSVTPQILSHRRRKKPSLSRDGISAGLHPRPRRT